MTNRPTRVRARVHGDVHFDYTTVGHVTIDVLADGSSRAGGSAFYSALQAARLGLRTLIITRGVAREIEQLLEPYRSELELAVLPASATTTLATSGLGAARRQRMLAWAGPIEDGISIDTTILHLAPVARETPRSWLGDASFIGLTPQGLVRTWAAAPPQRPASTPAGAGEEVTLSHEADDALAPERWDALVLSEDERAACTQMIERTAAMGAVAAITAEGAPTTVLVPGGRALAADVAPLAPAGDDLGAGDVFAAAFFVALAERRAPGPAAALANAAAAIRLAGVGAQAIGDRTAIEARLQAVSP